MDADLVVACGLFDACVLEHAAKLAADDKETVLGFLDWIVDQREHALDSTLNN
jgi:hypothetical protein